MTDKSSATTVAIPATIEDAVGALNGIDALLTAKGWERAAIVYAFTEPDPGAKRAQTSDGNPSKVLLSISDFAKLGIAGLATRETVAHYRKCWIDGGGDPFTYPGATVELPTGPFPPPGDSNFGKRVSPEKAKATVEQWSPEAKAEAVKALIADEDPLVADAVDKAVDSIPRIPATPKPQVPFGATTAYNEVTHYFAGASFEIEEAIKVMERAVEAGIRFDDLAFSSLSSMPESTFDDLFIRYRKTVGMLAVEEGANR